MWRRNCFTLAPIFGLVVSMGCDQAMSEQPHRRPLQPSRFFVDGQSSRPLVAGTVAQGQLRLDDHLYRGIVGKEFVETFPFPITGVVLERGRERFNIFCSPCHDRTGDGHGTVVGRGYVVPPSYHLERLRRAAPGYFFDVITNGFGAMPDYKDQVPVRDRWAIVAYLRALQASQNARPEDVPLETLLRLEAESP
ncbi:MAG TPA: cytochrome c [Planctomycetota bacterium]|nr:cytochrome c [Planctomycetota bacterium]